MKVKFLTTGGTIDKIYFDAKSRYEVGEPQIARLLEFANVTFDWQAESILQKDSLDITDADREMIVEKVKSEQFRNIVITHGTDRMVQTALALRGIPDKVIVLTGSMQPANFRDTDALFNLGFALGALQALPEGVYVCINGRIFNPEKIRKNIEKNIFEEA